MSVAQKRIALDDLARSCHLPQSVLKVLPSDELSVQLPASSKYRDVDCMLQKLQQLRGFGRIGFVGNQAFTSEKK